MSTDPFTRLGFEPRFDLAPDAIRLKAVRTAARLHPDRATDPVDAHRRSQELSAVNEAAAYTQHERRAPACDAPFSITAQTLCNSDKIGQYNVTHA